MTPKTPLRLLIVDDDPRDAQLCIAYLQRGGYDVQTHLVASPNELLQALHTQQFDLVLTDYRIPGWSGLEAIETLRRHNAEIPIILVSGAVGEEAAVECIRKGANDYILKDRPGRLPLAVKHALDEAGAAAERRRGERTRELLASIVESSDDAIVGIAADGVVLTWNAGAQRIFGYAASDIAGQSIERLFPADGQTSLKEALGAATSGNAVGRYETKGLTRHGRALDLFVTLSPVSPLNGNGNSPAASAIIRDITETRTLQNEFFHAQKLEAVGRLAAGVAHDFNNLLTIVNGYTSLVLAEMPPDDRLRPEVAEIGIAGERAASLTRQLLAFSRRQILQPRVLDLNRAVSDIERMLKRLIGEDIDLLTVLDPGLGQILCDPGQIEQVLMNLAVNSRDAMPDGGRLTITTLNRHLEETVARRHAQVLPGHYVVLAMSDTGTGMAPTTQDRIFEPFFTTKGPGEGTGLGLATVYGIVAQSGGSILVYSELGHGTCFKIYFPRVSGAPYCPALFSDANLPTGTETILVVEDEKAVRDLACSILRKRGFAVMEASNGPEGLALAQEHHGSIDLLLTDVIMPKLTGSELATRIRAVRPDIRVLFMSGYSDSAIIHRGALEPSSAFLEKPFTPPALILKVREILDAA